MDTKLKNRHKLFVVIWVFFALCLSANLDNMYMTTSEAANVVAAEMVAMAVAAWIFPMFRFLLDPLLWEPACSEDFHG